MDKHVLSVLVKNSSGVLSRVSGLFSRMTIALNGDEDVLEQVKKQLNKLEDVICVTDLNDNESVYRELVLIKVRANAENRAAINETVKIFRSKIIDLSTNTLTIELTGDEDKVSALISLMEEYGIEELVRTGITALQRGEKTLKKSVEELDLE